MKLKMLLLLILVCTTALGQKDTVYDKLPPIEMLLKNESLTEIYELPYEVDYKIYNIQGGLIDSGYGQFIDITEYDNGTYFLKYDGETKRIKKELPPSDKNSNNKYLLYALGFIVLLFIGLFFFIKTRIRDFKIEKQRLLQEIKDIKESKHQKMPDTATISKKADMDIKKISKVAENKLNESDWKIIHQLVNQPSISNKELANQVSLSVEGTRSSLKKMYRIFEISSSRNMRLSLVLTLIKLSNPNS